jgi:polysaccharide export outer membrane protein
LFGSPPQAGTSTTPVQPGLTGVTTTIPPQVIEADGTVMIPFVGRTKVTGKTPGQVGLEVEKLLEGKSVSPQVIVTLLNAATSTATVGGDVNAPKPVPLTLRGERLLDVVAAAGGAKFPAYEEYVTLVRNGHVATVLLQTVVSDSSENILIRPNDQVFLTHYPRTFAALGATSKVSQYTFDTPRVTLAEAVARAGGPIDAISNLSGVYLFRYEPITVAEQILGKEEALTALASVDTAVTSSKDFVPILYRLDFRQAGGYFFAQDIEMRDKDVILVTNADTTQLQKALTVVRGFTGIAFDLSRQATLY